MPPPLKDAVHRYFSYDTQYNKSACELCKSKLKGRHTSNLKNHLATKHRKEYNIVEDLNKSRTNGETPKQSKTESLIENLKALCVQLVMVHGRPLDMMDDVAFQAILNMAARGNVASRFLNGAAIKQAIEEEENLKLQEQESPKLARQSSSPKENARLKNTLQIDPGPDTSDNNKSNGADCSDPLKDDRAQCRLCGEFTKDFIDAASNANYVADNKTSLSFNGINIEINFNDKSPNTVCVDCDGKLKQMLDFVKLVKFAQDNLINVVDGNEDIVKNEYESHDDDDDKDDTDEEEIETANKSKLVKTHKRKSNKTKTPKRKKTKVGELERDDCKLVFEVKEEITLSDDNTDEPDTYKGGTGNSERTITDTNDTAMETDSGNDANEDNEVDDANLRFGDANTGTAKETYKLKMATRALMSELVDKGAGSDKGNYG